MLQRWSYLLLLVSGVNLIYGFEFLRNKQNHVVDRGSSLDLNCKVNDNTAEVFLWHKFSQDTRAYEIPVDDIKLSQRGMTFTLMDIGYHDNGLYECVAVSRDGSRLAHVIADIKVKPNYPLLLHNGTQLYNLKYDASTTIRGSKPFIIFDFKSPYRVPIKQTKELRLAFKLKGLRPIRTKWKKDNITIAEEQGIKASDTALTVLPPFSTNHTGNYELMACNSQGCTLRGLQILFYGPKEKKDQSKDSIKWTHVGLALSSITIVAVAVTLLILKRMGLILKSTKQRLEEEAKKTKEQFRRGSNSKSGSIWNYKAIPVNDETVKQGSSHNTGSNSTVSPAVPQTPRPTPYSRGFSDNHGNAEDIYEDINDLKSTIVRDEHCEDTYQCMEDVRMYQIYDTNDEDIYQNIDDIKRVVAKNAGNFDGDYEDMNNIKNNVNNGSSEDIYQNIEDIRMYRNYDANKGKTITEDSGNDEGIYQTYYDAKTSFETTENSHGASWE